MALAGLSLSGNRTLAQSESVSVISDPGDPVASSASGRWALKELAGALEKHGVKTQQFASLQQAPLNSLCVVASTAGVQPAAELLKSLGVNPPSSAESLALVPFAAGRRRGLVATGDERGLIYALLELADRVLHSERPFSALEQREAVIERPLNSVRSIGRIFCSDIQDKPWFYDREMWPAYFSMLAMQRFNRFSLNLGVGYDFLDDVRDAYFLFVYPFLLPVPTYNVRVVNLPDDERDRNLGMLQFISTQAVERGIEFQLGIWTHGYHWGPSVQPNYTIEGVNSDNHAVYSRDALTALLKACPHISGITLRTHGESGVREGSYSFWSTVFSALPACGRKIHLDLHTKGLDQNLIDAALHTAMPVTLSPKYWAEHMGLPYQQAAIRELEMPHESHKEQDFFSFSSGSRSFTRYGYADFLREDRPYQVTFRIWPGSHRLLLWGDPSSAAAHARAFNFSGCNGVELFEPLSFKGRRGSGIAGSRCAYADKSLEPHWDWEKYLYTYRTWGRLMYNPDAAPDTWQRFLRKEFRSAAPDMEAALASATSICEIITTAHSPSAANEGFSPEYYANQSVVDAAKPSPYSDTPAPKTFANVSPLDPQLFSTINEFAAEITKDERSGKYSPLEVAQWLDAAVENAATHLREAERRVSDKGAPEFRRAAIDLKIEIGIGRFFAAKFRSGVLYAAHEQTGNRQVLEESLREYRRSRDIWKSFAEEAKDVYLSDITFGTSPHQRGNWLDRLPAIDDDIAEMQKRLEGLSSDTAPNSSLSLKELMAVVVRESANLQHTPPSSFVPSQPLEVAVSVLERAVQSLSVRLFYRHVNQSERYEITEMLLVGNHFKAAIPAVYTNSQYPLQYYFELRHGSQAWLFPGLGRPLRGQPYFVISSRKASEIAYENQTSNHGA